jgi:predicted glycosyltransferase
MAFHKPRILLYSHDTYGLGHLRRSLAIAHQFAADIKGVSQLLVTGSMVAGAFALPPGLDMVKLPALTKRSNGDYTPRALPMGLRDVITWRQQMILQAAVHFRPDMLLVDKSPAGVQGELLPVLRYFKTRSPETVIVLGMRDIEDSPDKTRAEWAAQGVPQLLEAVYDVILLYGQREFFDPIAAYRLPPKAASKFVETGYLGRTQITRDPNRVRRELGVGDGALVVVTVGGGGDGFPILKTYLDMVAASCKAPPFHSLVVTGPLMASHQRELLHHACKNNHLTLLEFTPDLVNYMAAADLVISMAGYNTVCEILSLGKRAVLIPRQSIRAEQRMRAERLAARGLARLLRPEELSPSRLMDEIQAGLAAGPLPAVNLDMSGLSRVSAAVADLLAASDGIGNGRQHLPVTIAHREMALA